MVNQFSSQWEGCLADVPHATAEQEAKRNRWLGINIQDLPIVTYFNQVGPLPVRVLVFTRVQVHVYLCMRTRVYLHMEVRGQLWVVLSS